MPNPKEQSPNDTKQQTQINEQKKYIDFSEPKSPPKPNHGNKGGLTDEVSPPQQPPKK